MTPKEFLQSKSVKEEQLKMMALQVHKQSALIRHLRAKVGTAAEGWATLEDAEARLTACHTGALGVAQIIKTIKIQDKWPPVATKADKSLLECKLAIDKAQLELDALRFVNTQKAGEKNTRIWPSATR